MKLILSFYIIFSKVDNDRSVFLSNLLFTVDELQIRTMFSIVSIPIVFLKVISSS